MKWNILTIIGVAICIGFFRTPRLFGNEPASQYMFAVLELRTDQPEFITAALSDHPEFGFASQLSPKQIAFLTDPIVRRATQRIANIDGAVKCNWSRFSGDNWSEAGLMDRLHSLACITLTDARKHYEAGEWLEANKLVARVKRLSRDMVDLSRPAENQCFMIENMANATAAAYLLDAPMSACIDLAAHHKALGNFSPMADLLDHEAHRVQALSDRYDNGTATIESLIEVLSSYCEDEKPLAELRQLDRSLAAMHVRRFAEYLISITQFLEDNPTKAQTSLKRRAQELSRNCLLINANSSFSYELYLENAQARCRSIIFSEVLRVRNAGSHDFSRIADPYGQEMLRIENHPRGHTLYSDLKHFSNIDFSFGMAHAQRTTNNGVNPSPQLGR